jgi:cytochrome b6-f complex subunit 4
MGTNTVPGLLISRPDLADPVLLSKIAKGSGHNSYGEPAFPNDLMFLFPVCILCTVVICLGLGVVSPVSLGDSADPFVTPSLIRPEWYLYPSYVLLRRIRDKVWGLAALVSLPIGIASLPFIEAGNKFQNPVRRWLSYGVFIFGLLVAFCWGSLV